MLIIIFLCGVKNNMKKLYDIFLFICSIVICVSALWLIAIEITDTPDVYMSYETKVCRKVIIYDEVTERFLFCQPTN